LKDEPQFLLLDEPTNHLDLEMINRLENYLSRSHITLFMITHDRYFLDRICTDIRELDRGKLHQYTGNYKDFLYKKSQREEREALQVHKLKQLYTAELEWIRRAPSGRQTKKVDRIA
jgi:ATP-binding cassette subfamily F protein uup